MRLWQVRMHRPHHAIGVVRSGDREHAWMRRLHDALFRAKASCDDDLAVLRQGFADGMQRLRDRGVDEAAGIDDDEIRAGVIGRGDVALSAQLREDALGIYKCLRTA